MKTNILSSLTFLILLCLSVPVFGGTTSYEYDELNRLTEVTYENGTIISYTYDALGNRTSQVVQGNSTPQQYVLTTSVTGGNGTVSPTSGIYATGTVVTLTATPNSGYMVKKWTGTNNDSSTANTNSVTMNSNKTVTVEFVRAYSLTASVTGGNGTVSPTSGIYATGTVLTLTATPNTGYKVKQWTGTNNDSLKTNTNTVTMNSNKTVTVVFEAIQVIRVPTDYSTIQAGIDAAFSGDTVLVANGEYLGTGNKDLDFHGKAITLKSENGPNNCSINCQGSGRAVKFITSEGRGSVVSGFTIKKGYAQSYITPTQDGGGILCKSSSPTITNCIFYDNHAYGDGGAIACIDAAFPAITNCTFTENKTNEWPDGYGGGISCKNGSSPDISQCVFKNNIAYNGGAISCNGASNPIISNCIIASNSAQNNNGGGVFCDGTSSPAIMNCTIADNTANTTAGSGGGIYRSTGSNAAVTNSILWGNLPNQLYGTSPNPTYSDIQGGSTGTGNINSNPLFVGSGDYHLTATSPCIDKGTLTGAPNNDIDGNTRPFNSLVDIGADEVLNIILNSGFESGTTNWTFYTNGTGSFVASSPGYNSSIKAGKVTVTTMGTTIQLYQANLVLTPNTQYTLSFVAYSSTGHDLRVSLTKQVSPYTNYGLANTVVNLTTGWPATLYTYKFTTANFSSQVTDGRLLFWFATHATAGDVYWIDDVKITR